MKVEALKEKARRHEQKEEWQKALDLYQEALGRHDEEEPPDIPLYNRVGDLQIRVGKIDGAVGSYETAIDLYMDAELPNNAIAICKKVLRNLPGRSSFFRRMGQIRASQGFLTDARQNFLTFAEQMTAAGDMDAALDALVEFVSLAPDDLEIRLGLASQLESHGRTDEAMEHYADAYGRLILLDQEDEAEAVAEKVRELSPETVLPDPESIRAGAAGAAGAVEEDRPFTLGSSLAGMELDEPVAEPGSGVEDLEITTSLGEMAGEEAEEATSVEGPQAAEEVSSEEEERAGRAKDGVLAGEEADRQEYVGEEEIPEEEPEPLPTLSFEDEEDEEALPTFGLGGGEDVLPEPPSDVVEVEDGEEGEPDELPTFDFEEGEEAEALPGYAVPEEEEAVAEEELGPLPTFGFEEGSPALEEEAPSPASEEEAPAPALEEEAPAPALEEEAPAPASEEEAPAPASEEEAPAPASEVALEGAVEDSVLESATVADPATHQEAAEQGDPKLALEMVQVEIESSPDEVELYQRMVEYAFRTGDQALLVQAYMELARCLVRTGVSSKARSIYQQVLSLDPEQGEARDELDALDGVSTPRPPSEVASSEEYVDLGSMILGEEAEKTTRWQVAADAPSGDEQADFAKMLSQFKDKVSEHVDAGDVAAHHDLGTAYMEMGLFEEAISEFQMALRASPNHLPTHEVMGRCWMESDQPDMAVRALQRALESSFDVEDELIGIYYLMGRAQEAMGNEEQAVEYYEKVFSLDINFEDVTERLRALR